MHQRPRSGLPVHTAPALHSVMEISICGSKCDDLFMVNIMTDLVTEEVAPVPRLYAHRVGQVAAAVQLAPGQGLVTVEVCLLELETKVKRRFALSHLRHYPMIVKLEH